MKRFSYKTLLAAAVMLISVEASAYDFEVDNIYYEFNDDSTTVAVTYASTSYNSYSGSVVVPSTVTNGDVAYTVTAIGTSAFRKSTSLTSVSIPSSATEVGTHAFYGCTGLTSVTIPDNVESLGQYIFYGCTGLTSVVLPAELEAIPNYAFYNCSALPSVTIPSTVKSIGTHAFYGCKTFTTVTLPSGLTAIEKNTFYNCTGLTSITIPDSVITIDIYAFYGCSSLESVTLPDGLTSIATSLFRNCSSLASIAIPAGVTEIGDYAFTSCTSLKSVSIPTATVSIGKNAFQYCTGIESMSIPDNVTSIGANCFYGATSLVTLTLPVNLTAIDEKTFYQCIALASVALPDKVSSIGDYSFYGCTSLVTTTFPASLTSMGAYAFQECTALTTASLSDSVTSIGDYAFYGCTSLSSVSLPATLTSLGERVFYGCTSLASIAFPPLLKSLGGYALYGCTNLTSVTLPDSLETIDEYTFYGCSALEAVEAPKNITSIGQYAFHSCTKLMSFEIPSAVSTIGDRAFYNCSSLTAMDLPSTLTSLGSYAFYGCAGITSIEVPEGITRIETYTFSGCTGLTTLTLPTTLQTFGSNAFSKCTGLTALTLPANVTSLAASTFASCTNISEINTLNTTPPTLVNKNAFATEIYTTATVYVPIGYRSAYEEDSKWSAFNNIEEKDFSASDVTLTGDGSAENPYQIGSVDEWNYLAQYMYTNCDSLTGKHIKITDDIDFTNASISPLGYRRSEIFNGDLNGNGKTIKGISATADSNGFGCIAIVAGDSAYIHDLIVEGSVSSQCAYTGGVVAYLYGKMSNVTSNVTVSGSGQYTAGMVAYIADGGSLTDCVNGGSVTSTASYCAGLAAQVGKGCTLSGCVNQAAVSGSASYTAGLAAYVDQGSNISNCANKGTVSCSASYMAGLVATSMRDVVYENCQNSGKVYYTGSAELAYAAGIVGVAYPCQLLYCGNSAVVCTADSTTGIVAGILAYPYSTYNEASNFYLKGCGNSGNVTAGYGVAGVMSNYGTNTYSKVDMDSCYNTGNITATYGTDKSNYCTAGIAAAYFHSSTYTNCWNEGAIASDGPACVAGVLGAPRGTGSTSSTAIISGCNNYGAIVSDVQYAAGVVAYVGDYTYVDNCGNTASVTGKYYCGGVAGHISTATSSITSSFNAGDVTVSLNRAGGIVGNCLYRASISSCFNVGNISTTSETQGTAAISSGYAIGGIAGMAALDISDVYNAGTITGASRVGGLVGSAYKSGDDSYATIANGYSSGAINAPADSCGMILGCSVYNGAVWSTASTISETYYLVANDIVAETSLTADTASTGLSYVELAALDLGDGWTAGDNYTYPRIASIADNDYAKAYAAAVVPADGDSYSSITTGFNVGTPDGVTWTASTDAITFDGNTATFTETVNGTVTLTATCGDVSVATEITCNVEVDGISDITGGDREVVEERFYTPSGAQVAEPAEGARAIYIVVKSYSDGTTETVKEVR